MTKPIIDAREAVHDIRSGMDDAGLMEKYGVSSKGLQSLFRKIRESGMLDEQEFLARIERLDETGNLTPTSVFEDEDTEELDPATPPSQPRKRVVLLSVDPTLESVTKRACDIRNLDLQVQQCESSLVDAVTEGNPNIIVADCGALACLPGEVIAAARRLGGDIPVITVVDAGNRAVALRAIEQGAFDFIQRPPELSLLAAALRRAEVYDDHTRLTSAPAPPVSGVAYSDPENAEIARMLKGVIDSSTLISVVRTDRNQIVQFWNHGAEKIFGFTAEEMIGSSIARIYPQDALTRETVSHLRELAASKTGTFHAKMKQIAKDGRVLTIALSLSPLLDRDGEVEGIVGIGLDVSEEVRQSKELLRLLNQVRKNHEVTVAVLVSLLEAADERAASGLERFQKYCKTLALRLRERVLYRSILSARMVDDIVRTCRLHDIGRMGGVSPEHSGEPDAKQNQAEFRHPLVGGKALEAAQKKFGEDSFLGVATEIAYFHHERWDGTGYPYGRAGENIPLPARIAALADAYETLTTSAPGRQACSHHEASRIIVEGSGTLFDPEVVAAFHDVESDFWGIAGALG